MFKFQHLVLLLSVISLNPTYSMISEFKYKPWVQCPNEELSVKRICGEVLSCPYIETRIPIGQEQNWQCFDFALYQITGNITPLQVVNYTKNNRIIKAIASIDIEKFFDQIPGPEKGALVLYTDDQHNIQHFAVVIDHVTFESKWGLLEIRQHKPFDVPCDYGDNISFWKLKEEFTGAEGKKLLLETIKEDAEKFNREQEQEQAFSFYKSMTLGVALGLVLGIGSTYIIDWMMSDWIKK